MPKKKNIPIFFLTDYGNQDEYVGVVKSVIQCINPNSKVIDITHEIKSHDVHSGIYILSKIIDYLPRLCIVLGVVDPGVGSTREGIVGISQTKDRKILFVGPNNGLFTPIFSEKTRIFEIDHKKVIRESKKFGLNLFISNTFHGRDIFGPVSAFLSLGRNYKSFVKREITSPVRIDIPNASVTLTDGRKTIKGHVIYIDKFGNIVTNIKDELIEKNQLHIEISGRSIGDIRIVSSYAEGKEGEIFGIIGSYRTLEISLKQASASEKLGAKIFDTVSISFEHS